MRNVRNRNPGPEGGHTTTGSNSAAEHKKRYLEQTPNMPYPHLEAVRRCKVRKGTNRYVDLKSKSIAESYDRAMVELHGEDWKSIVPNIDDKSEWLRVWGGKPHGKVYCFGSIINTSKIQSTRAFYTDESLAPLYSSNPEQSEDLASQLETMTILLQTLQAEREQGRQRGERRQQMFGES